MLFRVVTSDYQRVSRGIDDAHVVLTRCECLVADKKSKRELGDQLFAALSVRNHGRHERQTQNEHQHRQSFKNLPCHVSSSCPCGLWSKLLDREFCSKQVVPLLTLLTGCGSAWLLLPPPSRVIAFHVSFSLLIMCRNSHSETRQGSESLKPTDDKSLVHPAILPGRIDLIVGRPMSIR